MQINMPVADQQQPVRWGILGLGWIASDAIAPALASISNARLHRVCSRDAAKAREFCASRGAQPFSDLQSFLADPELEAVYVATPNGRHVEDVLSCAGAGKHVLCDKPLAADARDAERAIAACAAAGVKLGVGYQLRFDPVHREMARWVQEEKLGRIACAHIQACFRYPFPPPAWRTQKATAGGGWATADLGTHLIDLLLSTLGEIAEVQAMMSNGSYRFETEDTCSAVLGFRSGAIGTMTCSTAVTVPNSVFGVYGERGFMVGEGTVGISSNGTFRYALDGAPAAERALEYPDGGLYAAELEAFSAAVRSGRNPEPDGEAGLRATRVLDAIRQSHETGRKVAVG
jgi:predicted dehydrogenase